MRLALKKTARPTLMGQLAHAIGKRLDHTLYSHGELVFSDRRSASSVIGTGVRFKDIPYDTPGAWDFFTLPSFKEPSARAWFEAHEGEPYDYFYMARFGVPLLSESLERWGCIEAIGAALGWRETWRLGPGGLLSRVRDHFNAEKVSRPWPDIHPAVLLAMQGLKGG